MPCPECFLLTTPLQSVIRFCPSPVLLLRLPGKSSHVSDLPNMITLTLAQVHLTPCLFLIQSAQLFFNGPVDHTLLIWRSLFPGVLICSLTGSLLQTAGHIDGERSGRNRNTHEEQNSKGLQNDRSVHQKERKRGI